jgi:uncharacterized protein
LTEVDESTEPQAKPPKLIVNVADLRRRLGQRRTEPVEVQLETLSVVGSRTTEQPVRGELIIESIERGVSAVGGVVFRWEGDCRRCLEITGGELDVDIAELFQVDAPPDSELIRFDGDQIDLVPIVRDAVLLSLPLVPLCREDCAGPDPDRYPAQTVDDFEQARAEQTANQADPRWAALEQLNLEDSGPETN